MYPRFALCLGLALALAAPAAAQLKASARTAPVAFKSAVSVELHEHAHVGRRCGASHVTDEEVAAVQRALEARPPVARFGTVTVPIAFHVIMNSAGQGDIPDARLEQQVAVLNAAYQGTGFQFSLASVQRVTNDAWYGVVKDSQAEWDMKAALAVDPATTLNMYFANIGEGLLGWATFPNMYPENDTRHGVVNLTGTEPGGHAAPFNEGDTATHEVGHYLGLYHTFQGGCAGPGDSVDDTPAVSAPNFGCPTGVDSCVDGQGPDMVNNFMDYGDDACLTAFTPGQATRAQQMVAAFRPGLMGQSPSGPANDHLASATDIGGSALTGSNANATREVNEASASCLTYDGTDFDRGNSVFYRYTPAASGVLTVSLAGSGFDTALSLHTGDAHPLTEVACNDDEDFNAGIRTSKLSGVPVVAGQTYYVRVVGYDNEAGAITLSVAGPATGGGSTAEAEPNDDLATAQPLGGGSLVTLTGAAESADEGALSIPYSSGADDVEDLYRITLTSPGLTLALSGFNRDLDLFLINASGTEIVESSNVTGETTPEEIALPALAAGEYLVGVTFYDGTGETGSTGYTLRIEGNLPVADEGGPVAEVSALLAPAFPNPFRARATLTYTLPAPADVRLAVYDVLGREVARLVDGPRPAGEGTAVLDAAGLAAGVYVARIEAGGAVQTQRLLLVR